MQVMNGAEAIKKIRQEYHYAGLIYSVTGNDDPVQLQELRDAGATDVFLKPIKVAQVTDVIKGNIVFSGCYRLYCLILFRYL